MLEDMGMIMVPFNPERRDNMASETPQSQGIWYRLVHLNPALWRGLVVGVFALLVSVGVVVSPEIPDQLVTLIVAIAAFIQALWTRNGVVAEDKVVVYLDDPARGLGIQAGKAVPAPVVSEKSVEAAVYRKAA